MGFTGSRRFFPRDFHWFIVENGFHRLVYLPQILTKLADKALSHTAAVFAVRLE